MEVLLDTNFILGCVKQNIDFYSMANELFDEKINWIVPQQVLNELGNLKDKKGIKARDKESARIGFDILKKINPKIVDLGRNPNTDIGIVNYILGKKIVLATLDKDLKQRVDNPIMTIRGKKKIEIV